LRSVSNEPTFDIWKLINWLVVSYYWLFLTDFGQVSAVGYIPDYNYLWGFDFSRPVNFTSEYNIFINQTLFDIYSSYFRNTLYPVLSAIETSLRPLPDFSTLDGNNQLKPVDTAFLRSYSCAERRLKPALEAAVSILVADYALIIGGYTLVMFLAGIMQKHKFKDGSSGYFDELTAGNICEGCVKKGAGLTDGERTLTNGGVQADPDVNET